MAKTALVLSGGGALGAYEVGVWKALRHLNIKIDIVTGTSVGALNGIMVVQDDFTKCLNIWKNVSITNIYKDNITKDLTGIDLYKKYAQNFIKEGGMDPAMLEVILKDVYDKDKFYNSKIDYGIVTVNAKTLKAKQLRKKDINPSQLTDYAIASATCFPAFKMKKIENEKYIDGGYYDNLPINLAIDMGADQIIAVDLQAIGIKRRIKQFNGKIDIIRPHNKLMNMLEFDASKSKRAINLGYNDTLKHFNLLEGDKYTFKRGHLKKNYNKYIKKYKRIIDQITEVDNKNLVVNTIANNYNKIMFKNISEKDFNKIIENAARIFELPDDKVYSMHQLNWILKFKLKKTKSVSGNNIFKNMRKLNRKMIVKTMVKMMKQSYSKDLFTLAHMFRNEFFVAVYMTII